VETEKCRLDRHAQDCFKDPNLTFAGITLGPCDVGPRFICPKGDEDLQRFLNGDCGPTPEDCGCTLAEDCSKAEQIACYKTWKADPEAMKCFDTQANPTGWARSECYRKLKESRAGK
jgi:hypothetical protein